MIKLELEEWLERNEQPQPYGGPGSAELQR
jgi:hypothetical protein